MTDWLKLSSKKRRKKSNYLRDLSACEISSTTTKRLELSQYLTVLVEQHRFAFVWRGHERNSSKFQICRKKLSISGLYKVLTSVPISNIRAPLHTLRAHKKIIFAQMPLKLKKATDTHIHHHHHEQQEITRLINKFFISLSTCFCFFFFLIICLCTE